MVSRIPAQLNIEPPLLNSASPWATSYDDLRALYDCPFTGALTVRTSLLTGFQHDERVHQYAFVDSGSAAAPATGAASIPAGRSSLNTLGYSPVRLADYLAIVRRVVRSDGGDAPKQRKPIILSVTGSPEDVEQAYRMIAKARREDGLDLAMEVNLSCPNIKGKPPPAYDGAALVEYLVLLQAQKKKDEMLDDAFAGSRQRQHQQHQQHQQAAAEAPGPMVMLTTPPPVGIKLPPYTYMGQFEEVVGAIAGATVDGRSVVDFVTATNTLGSSLVLNEDCQAALASEAGTGIGGLAGAALHPLALGNVATLRSVLDRREATNAVVVIGVGGVCDRGGFERMRHVGAGAVAVATALGREGVGVFEKILKGEDGGELGVK